MRPTSYERYFLIDLDRCILNTNAFVAQFERIAHDIDPVMSKQLRQTRTNRDISFDNATWLISHYPHHWEHLQKTMIDVVQARPSDYYMPGATGFLQRLEQAAIPHGVLTFGGKLWQHTKLQALQLTIPYLVTDIPQKSHLISTWQQKDGSFALPEPFSCTATTVTLFDDKTSNLADMPQHSTGVLVHPQPSNHTPRIASLAEYIF